MRNPFSEQNTATPAQEFSDAKTSRLAYRPLDRRCFTITSKPISTGQRPELQAVWGGDKHSASTPSLLARAAGPACGVTVLLPDYHSFRGSYGGYAFPLYDRRPGHGPYNLKSELIAALGEAYGAPVTPEQVFDAMLALLSATSYTARFAEDLEDTFPHVPFTADPAVFAGARNSARHSRGGDIRPQAGCSFLKGLGLLADEPKGQLAWSIGTRA